MQISKILFVILLLALSINACVSDTTIHPATEEYTKIDTPEYKFNVNLHLPLKYAYREEFYMQCCFERFNKCTDSIMVAGFINSDSLDTHSRAADILTYHYKKFYIKPKKVNKGKELINELTKIRLLWSLNGRKVNVDSIKLKDFFSEINLGKGTYATKDSMVIVHLDKKLNKEDLEHKALFNYEKEDKGYLYFVFEGLPELRIQFVNTYYNENLNKGLLMQYDIENEWVKKYIKREYPDPIKAVFPSF
ncbi:MAG: hypothetical protein R2798_14380 [Chitinophagales bacterium]|nr:hypothetical protein [Bacteroidota bacterium]MCB9043477.1 hypothetical protein [Chitinophagales bacterium]